MADEWWSSPRGHGASACSTAPPTDKASYCWTSTSPTATAAATAESTSSITFQDPHRTPHQPLSDAASSVGDPHMDWAHAFFSGRTDTSLQVVLQDDMSAAATPYRPQPSAEETVMSNPFRNTSHSFLLEQAPLASSLQGLLDAAVPMSASHNIPMYGDSYSAMPVMPTLSQLMKSSASDESAQFQGSGAQLQYFSDSNMPFGAPLPSQLLLQALEPKHSCSSRNNSTLVSNSVSVQDACSSATRKSGFESPTVAKRPRIEAPSPLPTFKVRKEKLGDRITALQQLVSPFGKTDTASVLHEAIEYIKFLHEQVASLSTPYLKNGNPFQQLQKKGTEKAKEGGEPKQDLRSRGLCLVPIANTYTVASETAPEFWHPTFEGTFR